MTLIRVGGIAALGCAATYIAGFALLLTLLAPLGYGTGHIDPIAVTAFIRAHPGLMITWNSTIYIANALMLVVLVLALHARLKDVTPGWAEATRAFGLIWAALVLAAGMIANISVEAVLGRATADPDAAARIWDILHMVELGLGGGNEIAGGVWLCCVGLAAWNTGQLPRLTAGIAVLVGASGLMTVIPVLGDSAGAVFGLGAILWFLLVAPTLLRAGRTGP